MLRKMYLVSQEYLNKTKQTSSPSKRETKMPQPKKRVIKRKIKKSQNAHDKWFQMRNKTREPDVNRKAFIQMVRFRSKDFTQSYASG
jgi:hypothetical protein